MDGKSARLLCERGYGELIGVDACDWDIPTCQGESYDGTLYNCCTAQKNAYKLVCTNEKTQVLSHNYRRADGKADLLSPAVTVLEREGGTLSVVFCGSPDAAFNYLEGFAFLNETRKRQLADLLIRAGALPIYYTGDCEILIRAGRLGEAELFAAVLNLGFDVDESLELYLENTPKSIKRMLPTGEWESVDFSVADGGRVVLDAQAQPMYPLYLVISE